MMERVPGWKLKFHFEEERAMCNHDLRNEIEKENEWGPLRKLIAIILFTYIGWLMIIGQLWLIKHLLLR